MGVSGLVLRAMGAAVTRRARRSVEVRREEILSTTVELLDQLGLAATRVADVAEALDVSPALVFYHFGTKDDLVAEAFAHAVERDLHRLEKAASGEDPVERLRRVLRLYGPTGRATGWRIWIDAWAAGPARAAHPQGPQAPRPPVAGHPARAWSTTASRRACSPAPNPEATVARLSALVDGLSVAAVVHRSVTREQLRSWVAAQLAVELGVDVATLD